jgi:uncharacterized protein (TIGR03435 family)
VLARRDGKLGPQLKQSTLDCDERALAGSRSAPPKQDGPLDDFLTFCGALVSSTGIVYGHTTLDAFTTGLKGAVGSPVINRTGLQGFYAIKLTFAPRNLSPELQQPASPDDLPDFFTALQEQLGLKLQREKLTLNVLVIDHIERPTEN